MAGFEHGATRDTPAGGHAMLRRMQPPTRKAFDAATAAQRKALLQHLEHTIHQATHHAVEDAIAGVLAGLAAAGWRLQPVPGDLPYSLVDASTPGGPVTVRLNWMGSTSVLQQPPPPKLTAAQQKTKAQQDRFYAAADAAFAQAEQRGFSSLDARQQAILLVRNLEAEVNNGGFDQYFFNSAGDHALQTLEVLAGMGATKTARLLRAACALFPRGTPSATRSARQKQLRAIRKTVPQPFEKLDAAFGRTKEDLALLCLTSEKSGRRGA